MVFGVSALDEAEELSRPRCLELLGQHSTGRIALSERALPTVMPVTYRLIGDRLVFVTLAATPALGEGPRPIVAFQVDEIDPDTCAGWSVVVVGIAEEIDAGAGPFHQSRQSLLAGLTTEHISGRTYGPSELTNPLVPNPGH